MKVLELLDELKEEIENSPKTMFSGRRAVEADVLLEILGEIIGEMPEDIRRAQTILADQDRIVEDAKAQAEMILQSAGDELQTRVNESEVLKEAELQAEELKKTAEGNAKQITIGAKEYADDILQELETYLGDYLRVIRKNRLQLTGKRRSRPAEPPQQ